MEFEFYDKKLNWKKILIILLIILLIIGIVIFIVFRIRNSSDEKSSSIIKNETVQTFVDSSNSISVSIPSKYPLSKFSSDSNRVLELQSSDGLYVLFSKKDMSSNWFSVYDIIEKDKEKYVLSYENNSNLTGTTNYSLNNMQIYSYSFEYTTLEKTYCIEVYWVGKNNDYYAIDIVYPIDYKEKYSDFPQYILNNLKFIN